jgi:general secretion pathway protein F
VSLPESLKLIRSSLGNKEIEVVDRTLTLLEPAIILTLSMIVALIIVSLMSAIISINDLAI